MASTYDPYGLELSGVDPETSAELRKLKRQQDVADLLMQRGMESPQGKMVGDVYVKPSWTQGVSQLVNAYLSGQSQKGVDAGYQGIADKQKADEAARLEAMNKTMTGTPEIAPVMAPSMAMNPNPDGSLQQVVANNPQAAVPGNPRKAVEDYLMSRSPLMGALQRAKGLEADQAREENIAARKDTTQAALEQRKWELEQRLLDARISAADKLDAQKQLIRLTASLRTPAAPIQVTDAAGNVKLVDQRGNLIKDLGGVGKPSAGFEKAAAGKKKLATDLDTAISELEKATADGGLIDKSTGSGAGALVDMAAGFFGTATPGAVAAGQMAPIYDLALKMVPRFEGPQSDKDTKSYREAAGQLANPSVPNEQKKAAGKEILRLMKARKSQFIGADMAGTEADIPAYSGTVRIVDF